MERASRRIIRLCLPGSASLASSSSSSAVVDMSASSVSASEVAASSGSFLNHVPMGAPDPILSMTVNFRADTHPDKLNLGVGAYRTEEGKPWVLPVVRKAEEAIIANKALDKEYLGIEGLPQFLKVTRSLLYGDDCKASAEGRIATVQSLSGTGALRIATAFVRDFFPAGTVMYIPNPTWGNHRTIAQHAGVPCRDYTYFHAKTRGLDYEGMLRDLDAAPTGSVIVLHVCAHNPTGVDPSREQWDGILKLMQRKGLFPLFDCAYQGFASGDIHADAYAVRLFTNSGMELMACQSYSKNFGLYGERIGALTVVCQNKDTAERVESQLKILIRPMYSNPPAHGARIVAHVLSDKALFAEWEENVKTMADRIKKMRQALFDGLKAEGVPGSWQHILDQIGMFSYTGLTEKQVDVLINKYHIYMMRNGRVSMAGLSLARISYLVK